ncbi:MAG: hypothetical protein Q7V05_17210 [Methanoregula sp.]|nr:hypothetical protein [Methanoregula sp.]
MPVAATLALSDVSYTPNPPFVIGGQQHVTAKYYIGPSGATTFVKGHEIQMQTDLVNARWNIQIRLNGRNAAQQSVSGSAAFVNGQLLSYSPNNDVSLEVTIDGVVPQTQSDQVMVLRVEEIDNSGNVVPGSVITLSQPVAGQTATAIQTSFPTLTPTNVPPSPTKSAGFPVISGILAISPGFIIPFKRSR